ncbi:MAG TPA: A/G-specific adenine glycosylase [Betaproteobacteria bacterium]|nr:A/G-specific adenine glycosylase [Betaproteobacteria bacterium]
MNTSFAQRLIHWQEQHGRHDLPWQNTRDPYAVWLSEVMLQQTQVAAVIPYYLRFRERLPRLRDLAAASTDEVFTLWSGLGYYARAKHLQNAARLVVSAHRGVFPKDCGEILKLPGIGRSTAAAICVFAFGQQHAILDGNVKRVLARHSGIGGYPGQAKVWRLLWEKAEALLPKRKIKPYTQGLMDLGATICRRTSPRCAACPVASDCFARNAGKIAHYPGTRPKKRLPQKETTMLILRHGPNVLLERRPQSGIWGGLWSLPEACADDDPVMLCASRFGVQARRLPALASFDHAFTHFRLRIHPQPMQVARLSDLPRRDGALWVKLRDAVDGALPAPVRRLLHQLP